MWWSGPEPVPSTAAKLISAFAPDSPATLELFSAIPAEWAAAARQGHYVEPGALPAALEALAGAAFRLTWRDHALEVLCSLYDDNIEISVGSELRSAVETALRPLGLRGP